MKNLPRILLYIVSISVICQFCSCSAGNNRIADEQIELYDSFIRDYHLLPTDKVQYLGSSTKEIDEPHGFINRFHEHYYEIPEASIDEYVFTELVEVGLFGMCVQYIKRKADQTDPISSWNIESICLYMQTWISHDHDEEDEPVYYKCDHVEDFECIFYKYHNMQLIYTYSDEASIASFRDAVLAGDQNEITSAAEFNQEEFPFEVDGSSVYLIVNFEETDEIVWYAFAHYNNESKQVYIERLEEDESAVCPCTPNKYWISTGLTYNE